MGGICFLGFFASVREIKVSKKHQGVSVFCLEVTSDNTLILDQRGSGGMATAFQPFGKGLTLPIAHSRAGGTFSSLFWGIIFPVEFILAVAAQQPALLEE